jgi:glycosyltransferase involved in cell wall biosynthesis
VALVITRFTAGAGGVALRGALALDPKRFAVTVFTAPGGSLTAPAREAGIDVVEVPSLRPEIDPRADLVAFRTLTRALRKGRFELVHTHSAKAGAIGRAAARRAGVAATVHTFHGFPFHEFQSAQRRTAYVQIERKLARITDQFLAVGSAVAAEAIRRRIAPPDRIRVIPSAVDIRIAPSSKASRLKARRLMGVPTDSRVLGTVGRLDYQKAPHDFLAVLKAIQDPALRGVWVGGGPLYERIRAAADANGLADRLVLMGERDDVAKLLPGFDIFVLTSLYEGIPCALIEAMMCGIPVVATAVNSVHEVVIPGRTGLLARPADPHSVARAIEYLLGHPGEAARMVVDARAHLGDQFSPERLGIALTDTYERSLADRATATSPPNRTIWSGAA